MIYANVVQPPTKTAVTPAGQERTLAFQNALAPMAGSTATSSKPVVVVQQVSPQQPRFRISTIVGAESKSAVTYDMVRTAFEKLSVRQIQLPPLPPEADFKPVFGFGPCVAKFYSPNESMLAGVVAAGEGAARRLSLDSKTDASDGAKFMLSCIRAVNQLLGWQHVAAYIRNPNLYVERLKSAAAAAKRSGGSGGSNGSNGSNGSLLDLIGRPAIPASMDDIQARGQSIIKRLVQRIDWLLKLAQKAGQPFDPDLAVRVIAADVDWSYDANVFLRDAEGQVTTLLVQNQPRFHAFRDLQQKEGVRWPHSPELRCQIENAGFAYRPTMIKRDRCVCETCGVEVSGWRPWHDPWSFHDYRKHDPSFRPMRMQQTPPTVEPPTVETKPIGSAAAAAANDNAQATPMQQRG
jgi:hypothetical protein